MHQSNKNSWSKASLPPVVCLVAPMPKLGRKKRPTPRYALEHNLPRIISELADTKVKWAFAPKPSTSIEKDLQRIFDRLAALKKIEDVEDEYTFKPTVRAYTEAKLTIEETADLMGNGFPMPRIVPDGDGGIVADWLRNGKRVRLRFRANKERRDYIYHRVGEHYDVERATTKNLIERLGWLLSP
ncbi:MAG: hypothetical protein QOG00_1392 [Pyrinomonadaceae bacterium]|nr:hypothetical protein [Pyrinomonadaceae bacterium]